jgi:UDP-N-acetylglucosamine 2-epimerase (non-hydrolysing)
MNEAITINPGVMERVQDDVRPLHLVIIATKPDIIKQAPLILELRRRKANLLIVHSGQHYDWNLSKGMEADFNITPDMNLNVKGDRLFDQQAQIIQRFGELIWDLKKINKKIVPYTYSDTTTAVASGVASFANRVAVAHVEAGLRTMSPPRDTLMRLLYNVDVMDYYHELKCSDGWRKGSYEPYPEQFDSRASAPSAGVHLAPTELNLKHLRDEGYDEKRIFVVGNPVVDAIEIARSRFAESRIMEKYPQLKKGNFIRFCVHRRENVSSKNRFVSVLHAMENLVRDGRNVLFISLGATEKALVNFGLKASIEELAAKYSDSFIYSPVWPSYMDVVAAMEKCSVIATDSGSIQEEANVMGIPLVTLRFNSDRPETVFAGANIIAPPIRSDIVYRLIREVHDSPVLRAEMLKAPKLYGSRVSEKMVNVVDGIVSTGPLFELLEHEKLGFSKMDFWIPGCTEW